MQKIGVIGCGNISGIYLDNLTGLFKNVEVTAIADLDLERAKHAAEKYNIPKACTAEQLLADDNIDIVLNLTTPHVHHSICMAALNAGKHVYVEKPLSVELEHGKEIIDTAKAKNLYVGCAPDTFLGAGIQTCIKVIKDGWIGKPIAATAFMMCHGHESWHPDPEFYYQKGGGPIFDMGPYYLTALVSMIGSVNTVSAINKKSFDQRLITSEKKNGTMIDVDIPTHVAGTMEFSNGAVGTMIMSFDIWAAGLPCIEIYGTEGSIRVPDPNSFDGPVMVKTRFSDEWKEVPLAYPYNQNARGLGLSQMAAAIENSASHPANGDLAYHVLEVIHAFHQSSDEQKHIHIESRI